MLASRGAIRSQNGRPLVVLEGERCPGCNGRCGMRLAPPPTLAVDVDANVADGTPVEVVVAANLLTRRALILFAPPLATALGTALGVEYLAWDWREWLVPAALVAACASTATVLRIRRRPPRAPTLIPARDGLRLHL